MSKVRDKVVIKNLYEVNDEHGKYTKVMLYYRKLNSKKWKTKPIPPTKSADLMGTLTFEFKLVEKHPKSPKKGKKIKFGELNAYADVNTMWLTSGANHAVNTSAQITGIFNERNFFTKVLFFLHGTSPLGPQPSNVNVSIGPD